MPRVHPIDITTSQQPDTSIDPETNLPVQHDEQNDLLDVITPSSILNDRPGKKRTGLQGGKRLKWKNKLKAKSPSGGICHILALPEDVLRVLLGRIPPRELKLLGQTCAGLREFLEDESIWKDCFVNRFMGSVRQNEVKQDMKVLVQGCLGSARGWKAECLGREAMLERWVTSKAAPNTHHPSVGLIHSLSLSYPASNPQPRGTVGKTHTATTAIDPRDEDGTSAIVPAESSTSVSSPAKIRMKDRYDARIAATTRPPPSILSAGLGPGAVVKSDPISGKIPKGFWGPGRDANFHHHPQFNPTDPPTTIYLGEREQGFALWGRLDGSIVHTAMEMKHPSSQGARAQSVNTTCDVGDRHPGEVMAISPTKGSDGSLRFASACAAGRVKYWQFNAALPKSSKKHTKDAKDASMTCLFTSELVEPLEERSDEVKRRRSGAPDPFLLVKCDGQSGVVCGVTEDGDLRVWWDLDSTSKEARIDIGSTDQQGPIKGLELDVRVAESMVISVMVLHYQATSFERYDITVDLDGGHEVETRTFVTPHQSPLTAYQALLVPAAPISQRARSSAEMPSLLAEESEDSGSNQSSPELQPQDDPVPADTPSNFGRFIIAGDSDGSAWIWAWDGVGEEVQPMRGWSALERKVTTVDYNCGLVAIGGCDTHIRIFDPLPTMPVLLRSFRVHHLSPADLMIAESDDMSAYFLTVNQIILENDLVVASVGRKVFAWKAGIGKKGATKTDRKKVGGQSNRGLRTLDLRSLHEDVAHERREARARQEEEEQVEPKYERQEWAKMEEMGLDPDDALQYALMMSMEEQANKSANAGYEDQEDLGTPGASTSGYTSRAGEGYEDEYGEGFGDEDVDEAVRAVEEFRRREEEEMRRALEEIRLAEARESRSSV